MENKKMNKEFKNGTRPYSMKGPEKEEKETLADKITTCEGCDNEYPILYPKDVKKFIKFEKARRENRLRIHWNWLKDKSYKETVKFLNAITDKRAGEDLL